MTYADFLERKTHAARMSGFAPTFMPDYLFPFQQAILGWAVEKGRGALFEDCGLGKTIQELVWAQNVVEHTNGRVLVLTPLAVGPQTVAEGTKFGIECERSRDGKFSKRIVITNYEKLHLFSPSDFAGVVCDESSILKHFKGATQQAVTDFMRKTSYRLLATATPSPNDSVELGTSSEALGELGMVDMLSRFFKQDEKTHNLSEREKRKTMAAMGQRMEQRMMISGTGASWRLKGHAVVPFWKWVASWARACRKPSDLGFDDTGFELPPLIEREHIVTSEAPPAEGFLFTVPAFGLREERDERRRTLLERCELVARLVDHPNAAVIWCHLNTEGDELTRMIPGARQVKGSNSDEEKEETYRAFAAGEFTKLVIKPKIGAWGLNWQFCRHVVSFASHSWEQHYQSTRRCWRFGQTEPVTVDIISSEAEHYVRENMARKAEGASRMFTELVRYMREAQRIERVNTDIYPTEVPSWL